MHRTDDAVHRGVGGEHDHWQHPIAVLHDLEKLQAVHAGHAEVQAHHVRQAPRERVEAAFTVVEDLDGMPGVLEKSLDEVAEIPIVVDEDNETGG